MASNSDGNAGTDLPAYLSRHLQFGFDDEDVSALITSIDASQDRESAQRLPQLPAEILFRIVEHVPIYYVLQWRLVCRGFRDCIDGPVMFSYIQRAELIGGMGALDTFYRSGMDRQGHKTLGMVRCRFERLEHTGRAKASAKWGGKKAVFLMDDTWHKQYLLRGEFVKDKAEEKRRWEHLLTKLQLEHEGELYGKMRWCMRLDSTVLDLDLPMDMGAKKVVVDCLDQRVTMRWKHLLLPFIKMATRLRTLMEEKRESNFTFAYEEDCLRQTRRERLHAYLEEDLPDRGLNRKVIRWSLNRMPPLFGKPSYDEPAEEYYEMLRAENRAMRFLMPLRREAAMSQNEADRLRQLAEDRNKMLSALQEAENIHTKWMKSFGSGFLSPRPITLPTVPDNPFAWDDETRNRETQRVWNWKAQQSSMQQAAALAESSMHSVSVPEDAFDDSSSDDDFDLLQMVHPS